MRFCYHSIVLVFLVLTFFSSGSFAIETPVYGVVDYRILLAVHPMMAKLNPQTQRFEETVSSPFSNPEERKKSLEISANRILEKMKNLDSQIKKIISTPANNSKDAYNTYWKKRNNLNLEYKLVCDALGKVTSTGDYSPSGLPEEETLVPILQVINGSIKDVLLQLQKKHKLVVILDSSIFFPSLESISGENGPVANIHWNIWNNKPISSEEWKALKSSWNLKLSKIRPSVNKNPFKAGFKILTSEAVKLLKQQSEPSF